MLSDTLRAGTGMLAGIAALIAAPIGLGAAAIVGTIGLGAVAIVGATAIGTVVVAGEIALLVGVLAGAMIWHGMTDPKFKHIIR